MFIPAVDVIDTIEKEAIPTLRFANRDVLADPAAQRRRNADAARAAALGNNYHGKLDIYFQTAEGQTMRVATTVWAAHDEYLSLKSGLALPLHAVLGFDFY